MGPCLPELLSFLGLGVGQLYSGELRKALRFWGLGPLVAGALLTGGVVHSGVLGLIVFVVSAVAVFLWALADAVVTARKLGRVPFRAVQRWWVYVGIVAFLALGVHPLFLWLAPRALWMPSTSMEPTL